MFSVAILSHGIKEKMYKFRIPRKNQHWGYFYHSNLKVGPFGPPPVTLNNLMDMHMIHLLWKTSPSRMVWNNSELELELELDNFTLNLDP